MENTTFWYVARQSELIDGQWVDMRDFKPGEWVVFLSPNGNYYEIRHFELGEPHAEGKGFFEDWYLYRDRERLRLRHLDFVEYAKKAEQFLLRSII